MPFAALDDGFHSSQKVIRAGLDGTGLYARALSYCADQLTDGFVLYAWAAEIARPAIRKKVTAAGLWVEVAGGETFAYVLADGRHTVTIPDKGYFIPGYLEFNPTRASVLAKKDELSRKRSEAGKKGAQARWRRDSNPAVLPSKKDGKPVATGWPPTPKSEYIPRGEAVSQFGSKGRSGLQHAAAQPLPFEHEHMLDKLMTLVGASADPDTRSVFASYAAKLPQSALAKVIESTGSIPADRRARYANGALRSELAELEERTA